MCCDVLCCAVYVPLCVCVCVLVGSWSSSDYNADTLTQALNNNQLYVRVCVCTCMCTVVLLLSHAFVCLGVQMHIESEGQFSYQKLFRSTVMCGVMKCDVSAL